MCIEQATQSAMITTRASLALNSILVSFTLLVALVAGCDWLTEPVVSVDASLTLLVGRGAPDEPEIVINPPVVSVGEGVSAVVTVRNTGSDPIGFTGTLELRQTTAEPEEPPSLRTTIGGGEVELEPQESIETTTSFTILPGYTPGEYEVSVTLIGIVTLTSGTFEITAP